MAGPAALPTPCYCGGGQDVRDGSVLGRDASALGREGSMLEGFEGSALLHHGSRIMFGCIEFVFSVAAVQGF